MADTPHRSIAFAKTTRPVVGTAVPRERLFARLDGTPARTMAWISGPPGSGKTTLAASYVESRRLRSLWYQVDPEDDDIATFFHYLGHAARRLDGGRAREYPVFAAAEGTEVGAFARKFFRHLFSRAKGPFALVFDNLHAVPAQGALHKAIEAAIGQVPRQSCIIVASRNEPPVTLARFRVTGELLCIGGGELRIEPGELGEREIFERFEPATRRRGARSGAAAAMRAAEPQLL
jgi:ATP/maltotriose-dependent transcriptional regulator MalT